MKKIIVTLSFVLIASPAYADVYVKVDANGNAIGGAIVCEADVCGDPNSTYSRLTLEAGERYALQGTGTTGIGANNPNTTLKVDENNTWTITRTQVTELPTPVAINNQQVTAVTTQTVERFNPINPVIPTPIATPTTETSTATSETLTATTDVNVKQKINIEDIDWNAPNWWEMFLLWFNDWYANYLATVKEG